MTDDFLNTSRRGLMGAGALGLLAAGLSAGKANAQNWSAAERANVQLVTEFMHSVKPKDNSGVAKYLAPDCVYRLTETSPPNTTHEAILRTLAPYVDNAEKIEFEILATQALGPIVINHRIDRFTSSVRPLTFEGVGVFFIKGGKIKEWTDFTIRVALANGFPAA